MPDKIECDPKLLAYLDALIIEGRRLLDEDAAVDWLAMPVDESDRAAAMAEKRPPRRFQDIDYPAAVPVLQEDYGGWRGASYALFTSVVGKEHPWVEAWDKEVYGAVRGCVSAGLGVLKSFRTAWTAGVVWSLK
jgi:hypothetical protein